MRWRGRREERGEGGEVCESKSRKRPAYLSTEPSLGRGGWARFLGLGRELEGRRGEAANDQAVVGVALRVSHACRTVCGTPPAAKFSTTVSTRRRPAMIRGLQFEDDEGTSSTTPGPALYPFTPGRRANGKRRKKNKAPRRGRGAGGAQQLSPRGTGRGGTARREAGGGGGGGGVRRGRKGETRQQHQKRQGRVPPPAPRPARSAPRG